MLTTNQRNYINDLLAAERQRVAQAVRYANSLLQPGAADAVDEPRIRQRAELMQTVLDAIESAINSDSIDNPSLLIGSLKAGLAGKAAKNQIGVRLDAEWVAANRAELLRLQQRGFGVPPQFEVSR